MNADFDSNELVVIEADMNREEMLEWWFAERRTSPVPPAYRPSAPPIGDDDVDRWLR